MHGWVQDMPLEIDTLQFLKRNANKDMYRWKTNKDGIILINFFRLKFEPLVDH